MKYAGFDLNIYFRVQQEQGLTSEHNPVTLETSYKISQMIDGPRES